MRDGGVGPWPPRRAWKRLRAWIESWHENRRFDRMARADMKLLRDSLTAIHEVDPVLADTLRMRLAARVAQPVTSWEEFKQKRADVLTIITEGLDYVLAQP